MNDAAVQSCGFLLELSPDWLILRASENSHGFLGEYHQRLIDAPIAEFMLAQALHDLRNSLASQRSSSGISRCYHVRLVDDPRHFDIAFQSRVSSIILEGLPSAGDRRGAYMGSLSRLIDGLAGADRKQMMELAARRMRALTGFDHIALEIGADRVESSRGQIASPGVTDPLPAMVADAGEEPIALFPKREDAFIAEALLRAPTADQLNQLRVAGLTSSLSVPVATRYGETGHFQCFSRMAREPSFELHAAAELFAQIFGMLVPAH